MIVNTSIVKCVGQSSGDFILNLVKGGNDSIIISLHAFWGFLYIGLDMSLICSEAVKAQEIKKNDCQTAPSYLTESTQISTFSNN